MAHVTIFVSPVIYIFHFKCKFLLKAATNVLRQFRWTLRLCGGNKLLLKTTTLVLLFLFLPFTAFAGFDLSHQKFNQVLNNYVVDSENNLSTKVLYSSLVNDTHNIEIYLDDLSKVKYSEFSEYKKDDRLAFLINVYNAFTIKLILDNYGKSNSIKDIGSFFVNPWKDKFIKL